MRVLSLGAAIAALLSSPAGAAEIELGSVHYMPVNPGFDRKVPNRSAITDNGISYHGGPVMGTNPDFSNTPNIYFVGTGTGPGTPRSPFFLISPPTSAARPITCS